MRFFLLYFSLIICDSFNMNLLSHLTFEISAADITGFEQDGREFAVMGLSHAATFVDISDPRAMEEDIFRIYGKNPIEIQTSDLNKYDVVILAVNHSEYEEFYTGDWISPNQVIFDVKSVIQSDKVLSL